MVLYLSLTLLLVFIYSWYELHSSLKLRVSLKKPIFPKGRKLIEKTITASDGMRTTAWYLYAKNPKAIVILVHGYNGRKGENEGKT